MLFLNHYKILIYSLLLVPITLTPAFIGIISPLGAIAIALLGFRFIWHALKVRSSDGTDCARAMFRFSILYLFLIFVILLADHTVLTRFS